MENEENRLDRSKGKEVTCKTFYFRNFTLPGRILLKLKDGTYPAKISRELGITRQLCNHYISRLKKELLIETVVRSSMTTYSLTEKGIEFLKTGNRLDRSKRSSVCMRDKNTRLHNLAVKFPILKDNPNAVFEKKTPINHWIKQSMRINFPVGVTIEKTTKNIIVYFHQFRTRQSHFLNDFFNWINKGTYYVYYYLMREKDIQIDIFQGEIIRQHIAVESPEFDSKIKGDKTTSIDLGRKATSVFPTNFGAKAWLDKSLGSVDVETNDLLYDEKLIMMPETIHELSKNALPVLDNLTKQINLHLEVLQEMKKALAEMNKRQGDDARV